MRLSQLVDLPYVGLTPMEISKRVWLIDFPLRTYGEHNGKKNVLTFEFYGLMFSLLANQPFTLVRFTDGSTYTYVQEGSEFHGLYFYESAKSPAFSKLVYGTADAFVATNNVLKSFSEQSDRLIISWSCTAPINAQSVLSQIAVGSDVATSTIITLAGNDVAITSGQTITWRLNLFEPILKNFGYVLYGLLSASAPTGVVDLSGTSHDVRTNDYETKVATGNPKVQFGTSNNPFSFDDYAITNPIETTPEIAKYEASDYKYIAVVFTCHIVPANDTDIYEIGIVRTLYDSGGNTYDALLTRMVLSEPITLYGGKTNVIFIRLLAKE